MIKRFYKNHKEWFSLFTSAFAGTLLGIGLTFGISNYQEHKRQEDLSFKCLVMAINEIEIKNQGFEDLGKEMRLHDSIFQEVLLYAPDELDSISPSLANKFASALTSYSWRPHFNIAEKMLLNNIETLDIFEDLSIVNSLNMLYSLINKEEEAYRSSLEICEKIIGNYCKKEDFYNNYNDKDFIIKLFQDVETYHLLDKYKDNAMLIIALHEATQEQIEYFKENLNIKKEDLDDINKKHLKEVKKNFNEDILND